MARPRQPLIVATAIRHRLELLTMDNRMLGWAGRTGGVAPFAQNTPNA